MTSISMYLKALAKSITNPPVQTGGFDIMQKLYEKQRTVKKPKKESVQLPK